MVKEIFKAMDVNEDGSLDRKEMMALVEAYWKTVPEGMKIMVEKLVGESVYKKEMNQQLFDELDANKGGVINFEELHKAITNGTFVANLEKKTQ